MITVPLPAFNPGLSSGSGNWTWLIPGRVPTLVDAGVGDMRHLDAIEETLGGVPLSQVLVTHHHPDHVAGAPAIAARMPKTAFRKMPLPGRDPCTGIRWIPLENGERLEAGDVSLVVVHTPGHASDHLCFWHAESRAVFSGDLVILGTSVWVPPAPDGDLAAYIASLERILALDAVRMYPAHGAIVDDPASLLRRTIAHRLEREEQILDVLRSRDGPVEFIVSRVYGGLQEALVARADATVRAHLEKLEREGRAGRRGDAWHIIEP